MRIIYILLVLMNPCISVLANAQNLLLPVQYASDFERRALQFPDSISSLELFLASSPKLTQKNIESINKQVDNLVQELLDKGFNKKSDEKKIKMLFEITHKRFFFKYKNISPFGNIFLSKEYNCVSATALFCILLDRLSIPYEIREKPTHVYAVAYPETKKLIIESTAPQNGYLSPSNREIEVSVKSLIDLKYYTQDEVNSRGVRTIYNEFFFGDDEITLKELAGLQYHNEAVEKLTEEKLKESLNANLKSGMLYSNKRNAYITILLLGSLLEHSKFDNSEDLVYLVLLANNYNAEREYIVSKLGETMEQKLFFQNKAEIADSIYQFVTLNLKDTTIRHNVSEAYYQLKARYEFQKSNYNKSLEYSSSAFLLNPNNIHTQALITQCLVQELSRRRGSVTTVKKMDELIFQYSFLKENSLFQSLYFYVYTSCAINFAIADDIKNSFFYLHKTEEMLGQNLTELKYDENHFGMAYAELGASFFRKRDYKRAKEVIQAGLERLPEHPELLVRLQIVLDEMKY